MFLNIVLAFNQVQSYFASLINFFSLIFNFLLSFMQEIVYHTQYKLEDSYWWFVARNRIVKSLLDKFCKVESDAYWLDIGCGTGAMSKIISENRKVLCLDTSGIALEYAKKRGLENLFNTDLYDFPAKDYNIQGALMLDVVEHIANDKGIVKKVYEILPKGGWFVATVPAYQWLWSHHDVYHMHYRRYTKIGFTRLLKDYGFKIRYSSYFNTFLFVPAVITRITESMNEWKKSDSPIVEVSPVVNKILKAVFSSEIGFLKRMRFPFGVSIIAIAQK